MVAFGLVDGTGDPGPGQAGPDVPEGGKQLLGRALAFAAEAKGLLVGMRSDAVDLGSIHGEEGPAEAKPVVAGPILDGAAQMILELGEQGCR
jgi:hypothetical protein